MGTEQPQLVGISESAPSDPGVIDEGPFGWLQQVPLRNWVLLRGLKLLVISLVLAATLTVLAILLLSALASASSSIPSGVPYPGGASQTPSGDQLVSAFLVILGFFFFTALLAPYGADYSIVSSNAYGVGALLITSAIVVLAYRSGRQLQRLFPNSRSNFEAGMRAAVLVVPYWIGCLVLFLVSSLHIQNQLFGNVNLGPSPLGLFTPLVLVGGSAAVGAVRERRKPLSPASLFAVRGAVLGLFAIATGIIAAFVGAIVAILVALATHSSPIPSAPGAPNVANSGAVVPTIPSANSSGPPPLVVVLAILIGIFYIPNGLAMLWGAALGLNLASSGWLVLAFGLVGALVGALAIRPRTGGTEQVSFAVTFGLGSFVLAMISRPTFGAYALGGNPWIVLGIGLLLGAILAVAGPYAAVTGLGRSALALPLLQFAFARLPLPQLERLTPQPTTLPLGPDSQVQPAPKPEIKLPAIHFGRRAKIAAAATVVLVVIGIAGNVYVSSQTTPEASATAYVAAVASNNADAIWSHMTVIAPQAQNALTGSPTGANTPQLISEADLKAMLALPQNSHQPRSGISATTSVVRGDTATVSVSYSEQGQRRTETLSLLRDTGHNQYVFYPNWKVIQTAGTILINVPSPESLVAIDGTQLPKGGNSAVVLPGAHKITLLALGPFASADQNAVVQPGAYNQVSLRSVTLTPAAQTAATQAVKSYFTSCLQRTDAYSGDCPQHLDSFYGNNPVRWQLVGDPIQGLKFDADPNSGGVLAAGHSLMTAEVTTDSGTAHRVSGVPYTILLTWDGQAFQIKGLGGYYGGTQSALANPGADQSVILDAVKAGWQICLKATTFSPPDCPAQAFAYQAKDPKWTSTTDPMAGAIVNWDGSVGIYKVTGNYSVVVAYTGYYGDAQQQSLNGKYTAEVVWANQKAQLIDIKGG